MADTNIKFFSGTSTDFTNNVKASSATNGNVYFANIADSSKSYLYIGSNGKLLNIVPKLLSVANGGTGKSTLTKDYALVGNGTSAVSMRKIVNATGSGGFIAADSTNKSLITVNALANWNGSYNSSGDSAITHVGTITKGTWSGDIIAIIKGGTGNSEFNNGGVVYKDLTENKLVSCTLPEGKGLILVANEGTPIYAVPTLSWVNATLVGPTFKFNIDGLDYTATIPSASGSTSGIVTAPPSTNSTAIQQFAGLKQFLRTLTTESIQPNSTSNTLGAAAKLWADIFTKKISFYSGNNVVVGGISTGSGAITLSLGNSSNKAKGTLEIYNNNAYKHTITSAVTTANKALSIPNYAGNIVIANTADFDTPSRASVYRIPVFEADKKYVSTLAGYSIQLSDTLANLLLGDSGRTGSLSIYNGIDANKASTYSTIKNHTSNTNVNYTFTLPKLNGEKSGTNNITNALLAYIPNDSADVGGNTRPVYVASSGRIKPINGPIAVSYGGTGAATFTNNGVLYGKGTSAIAATDASSAVGQIIYTAAAGGAPTFGTPTITNTCNSDRVRIYFKINDTTYSSTDLKAATSTAWGVVSDAAQTFGGKKTFANGLASSASVSITGDLDVSETVSAYDLSTTATATVGSTLSVGGSASINTSLSVGTTGSFGGNVTINGTDLYIGSTSGAKLSYDASSDTLTISFP